MNAPRKAATDPARRWLEDLPGWLAFAFRFSVVARHQRESTQRGTRTAENLQRRNDDDEFIRLRLRQLLEVQVLDDVDPGVGDQEHVHGEDLNVRCTPVDDGRPHLEGQRVVADDARAVVDQEFRATDAGPRRSVRVRINAGIGLEEWAVAGADEYGVALLQLDTLVLRRVLQILGLDLE